MNEFITGKAENILKSFKMECIDLVVTSPPYDSLRNYKEGASLVNFTLFCDVEEM